MPSPLPYLPPQHVHWGPCLHQGGASIALNSCTCLDHLPFFLSSFLSPNSYLVLRVQSEGQKDQYHWELVRNAECGTPLPRPAELLYFNKIPRWLINALQFEKHCTRYSLGPNSVITSIKMSLTLPSNLSTYLHVGAVTYSFLHAPIYPPLIHPSIHPLLHPSWNLQTFNEDLS